MLQKNLPCLPMKEINNYCIRNGIRRIALFGSVLRDDFKDDSDIDILIEFNSDIKLGFEFIRIQDELSEILGHNVDLNTENSLSKYLRLNIMKDAVLLYDAA